MEWGWAGRAGRAVRGLAVVLLVGVVILAGGRAATAADGDRGAAPWQGKTVLWVDSYHAGYEWSDGIERGIRDTLAGSGVELQVWRMDTKRNKSEAFGRQAGLRARAVIEKLQPDLVIASDDNAQKYLVVPYLKDTALPIVFCGVNSDLAEYGYPCRNVTGMAEDELAEGLVRQLRSLANGDRVGILGGDTRTLRLAADLYNSQFFDGRLRYYLVHTFDEFKQAFLKAQQEVDMLLVRNNAGIAGWDAEQAEAFLLANVAVPTGSSLPWMKPYNSLIMAKVPEEQGVHAADTALRIFAGARPEELPVVRNRLAHLVVNLKMAKAAGVVLPVSLLQTAEIIGREAYAQDPVATAKGH